VSAVVRVTRLVKHFHREDGTVVPAVDDISFEVEKGEFVVLLGPSGCGKTTLLRCIAGLERPDTGAIEIDNRAVFASQEDLDLRPEHRRLSMIFQSYALWPHMTVFHNVAYPLASRRVPNTEIRERVDKILAVVGLSALAGMYPSQISGGQQQRVALARALVPNDAVILFDEPLSNVDAKVREQLRLQFLSMQREFGFAAVYVTHDQTEAMELAHRIAVMDAGKIVQLASPVDTYDKPISRYVANFVGKANELLGKVADRGLVATDIGSIEVCDNDSFEPGSAVAVVCRPEACQLTLEEPANVNRWRGQVQASLFLGSHTEHVIVLGSSTFRVWQPGRALLDAGTCVWVSVAREQWRLLTI
jgi:iron(III) transport system ATP-binding protein